MIHNSLFNIRKKKEYKYLKEESFPLKIEKNTNKEPNKTKSRNKKDETLKKTWFSKRERKNKKSRTTLEKI